MRKEKSDYSINDTSLNCNRLFALVADCDSLLSKNQKDPAKFMGCLGRKRALKEFPEALRKCEEELEKGPIYGSIYLQPGKQG